MEIKVIWVYREDTTDASRNNDCTITIFILAHFIANH